jgi:hypothetical protein
MPTFFIYIYDISYRDFLPNIQCNNSDIYTRPPIFIMIMHASLSQHFWTANKTKRKDINQLNQYLFYKVFTFDIKNKQQICNAQLFAFPFLYNLINTITKLTCNKHQIKDSISKCEQKSATNKGNIFP